MASDINFSIEIFEQDSFLFDIRITICAIACVAFLLIPYGTESIYTLHRPKIRMAGFTPLCLSVPRFGIKSLDSGVYHLFIMS